MDLPERSNLLGAEPIPLLRAGIRLSDSYRLSLERVGVTAVWIDDAFSEGIEPLEVLDESTRVRAKVAIHDAFRNAVGSRKRGPRSPSARSRKCTKWRS